MVLSVCPSVCPSINSVHSNLKSLVRIISFLYTRHWYISVDANDNQNCISFSHPGLGWLYAFSSFPPRPPPQLLPLTSKPFQLNLRYLAQSIFGSGEMYWMTFPWPWPKVMAVTSISKNLHDKVRITLRITTTRDSCIALVMVITWLDFGEVLLETVILANFLYKFLMVFFARSNTILAMVSQEWLVRLMWKEKEVHRLDTEYNMWPWPLTSLMT